MNLHEFKIINNLTIKEIRDLARKLCHIKAEDKSFILDTFKENPKINPDEMFAFFIENGLLDESNNKFTATIALRAIAGASLDKRKNKEKAWDELAKALARTVALSSSSDWFIEKPSKLFLFGSMLTPTKADYGDADLALTLGRKDSYDNLIEKQDNWLSQYKEYSNYNPNSLGFEDEQQLREDIASGSNFISIHHCRDIEVLSKAPNNIGNFPIFTLWENNEFKNSGVSKDTQLALELSQQWKENNPYLHKEIQNCLNKALSKLGIMAYTEVNFKVSCKDYIREYLAKELSTKLKKLGDDSSIVSRAVRMGNLGFEAIGQALRDSQNFDIELSKLNGLLNSMDKESEKHYLKGFTQTESKQKTLKLNF
jgi:hypothetical protein